MSLEDYDVVRQHPARFVVFSAIQHVYAEAEQAIEQADRYWVVEKIELPGRIATELDPRG